MPRSSGSDATITRSTTPRSEPGSSSTARRSNNGAASDTGERPASRRHGPGVVSRSADRDPVGFVFTGLPLGCDSTDRDRVGFVFTGRPVGCVCTHRGRIGFVFTKPGPACRVKCVHRLAATRQCPPLVEVERGQASDHGEIGHGKEVAACPPHPHDVDVSGRDPERGCEAPVLDALAGDQVRQRRDRLRKSGLLRSRPVYRDGGHSAPSAPCRPGCAGRCCGARCGGWPPS